MLCCAAVGSKAQVGCAAGCRYALCKDGAGCMQSALLLTGHCSRQLPLPGCFSVLQSSLEGAVEGAGQVAIRQRAVARHRWVCSWWGAFRLVSPKTGYIVGLYTLINDRRDILGPFGQVQHFGMGLGRASNPAESPYRQHPTFFDPLQTGQECCPCCLRGHWAWL